MQRPFEIKGVTFGEGRPVICVPVVSPKAEDILENIKSLASRKVQMIELRADFYEDVSEPSKVAGLLEQIKPLVTDTVLLFTFRTKKQGGNLQLSEGKVMQLNEIASKSGAADMIDLEFFETAKPAHDIKKLHKNGVKVIASHHDFHSTPDIRVMTMLLEQMKHGDADIAKLAVMPQSSMDVVNLLTATNIIKEKYPNLPLITMSMGGLGVVSRICGEAFGSCITFGADAEASAPGQMQMDKLAEVLNIVHESMTAGK